MWEPSITQCVCGHLLSAFQHVRDCVCIMTHMKYMCIRCICVHVSFSLCICVCSCAPWGLRQKKTRPHWKDNGSCNTSIITWLTSTVLHNECQHSLSFLFVSMPFSRSFFDLLTPLSLAILSYILIVFLAWFSVFLLWLSFPWFSLASSIRVFII